jgi:hypothetical protein
MPQEVQSFVATDAPGRARPLSDKSKVFTVKFRMEGELTLTASDQAEAYRLALLWSDSELAEVANLEMDDPVEESAAESGSVQ